jgi:SagB-type dehydrogenase family enzyme
MRMNPSSGNLHPTESYWILPGEKSFSGGIYHYSPFLHSLERRAEVAAAEVETWRAHFGSAGFLVALSSIFWREAWKYGERAFRYCHHDVGHALAALSFAANLMGWRVRMLHGICDRDLQRVLGFDQTGWISGEEEEADLICWVCSNSEQSQLAELPAGWIEQLSRQQFQGRPEVLSREHYPWPIIDAVAAVCRKESAAGGAMIWPDFPAAGLPESPLSAARLIRRRRSALAFDRGGVPMNREHFFGCLQACLPRRNRAPFDAGLGEPQVHLFIFVHHVTGLDPGLYALVRNPGHFRELQESTSAHFQWVAITEELPLYLLEAGDRRAEAKLVSCNQDIAGDGAFSLGMVARFREPLEEAPWRYKQLFWETGMIGQVLYLQAEAYGLRGTGIGCFFDDPMHEICGLRDNRYQSLYHFTIGSPIEDERLSTLEPYYHLKNLP